MILARYLNYIHGIIDRRILLNYRIDPEIAQSVLPDGFRPKLYKGKAIGGVCMIRFKDLRPRYAPSWLGINSENAAHRIAVEWEQDDGTHEGVYIPQRDTNSWVNHRLGGRVFPGIFNRSAFVPTETDTTVSLSILNASGLEKVGFKGKITDSILPSSIFPDVEKAASFFSRGATGYSATRIEGHFHGMDLFSNDWHIEPLSIEKAYSSFFADNSKFPKGSFELDCALLMRNIEHGWRSRPDLYFDSSKKLLSTNGKNF